MATLRPFKGFRPLPQYAAAVAAKPYDVLNSDEARAEAAGKPLSFLHVGKPEIDLPPEMHLYDRARLLKGSENLERLICDGILRRTASRASICMRRRWGATPSTGLSAARRCTNTGTTPSGSTS